MRIAANLRQAMREMGEAAYPNEGCGIFLGRLGDEAEVLEVRRGTNLREQGGAVDLPSEKDERVHSARDRYILDPRDQLQAEKDARARGLEVVGFWHTHPDHPARPSQFDADHAWAEYVYVIMAIDAGSQVDVTAWVLEGEDTPAFRPEPITD